MLQPATRGCWRCFGFTSGEQSCRPSLYSVYGRTTSVRVLNILLLVLSMAVDFPLVLYDCHFEGLSWKQEAEEVNYVLSTLQQHWTQSAVKSHVLHGMIKGLEASGESLSRCNSLDSVNVITECYDKHIFTFPLIHCSTGGVSSNHCWLVEGSRQRNYRPLLERPCCESLESRIDHFVKRGRLEREEGENGGDTVHRGKRSKHSHSSSTGPVSSELPPAKQSADRKAEDWYSSVGERTCQSLFFLIFFQEKALFLSHF